MEMLLTLLTCGILASTSAVIAVTVTRETCLKGGQSYWCRSLINAKGCNALSHCISRVWEETQLQNAVPQSVPLLNSEEREIIETDENFICSTCQVWMFKAREQLEKNATQQEIRQSLLNWCSSIPLDVVKVDCEDVVKEYTFEIIAFLASHMQPQAICAVIGFCNSIPMSTKLDQNQNQLKTPNQNHLERIFQENNPTRETPSFLNSLTTNHDVHKNPEDMSVSSYGCEICEFFVSRIDKRLQRNATEEEIRSFLDKTCLYLPKTWHSECQKVVDEYSAVIIHLLAKDLSPEIVCSFIGSCIGGTKGLALNTKNTDVNVQKASFVSSADPCGLCLNLTNYLNDMVGDTEPQIVEPSISELGTKICSEFPGSQRAQCTEMMDDYGSYLLSVLTFTQATDKKEKACHIFHLCPSLPSPLPQPIKMVETTRSQKY